MSDLICCPGTHAAMCLAEEEHGDTCPTPPTPQSSSIDVYIQCIYVHIYMYNAYEGLYC